MDDLAAHAEIERREDEVRGLRAEVARLANELKQRDSEVVALRTQTANASQHRAQESQLQRTILASLQSERAAYLEEIERLRNQISTLGADSARVAVVRAFSLLKRAILRRLGLFR